MNSLFFLRDSFHLSLVPRSPLALSYSRLACALRSFARMYTSQMEQQKSEAKKEKEENLEGKTIR